MATVAQQVILHPAVSQSLKVWSTTLGRDKVRSLFMPLLYPINASSDLPRRTVFRAFLGMAAPQQGLQNRSSAMERFEEPPWLGQKACVHTMSSVLLTHALCSYAARKADGAPSSRPTGYTRCRSPPRRANYNHRPTAGLLRLPHL